MELMWLYSLCQCMVSVSVFVASVRLCMTAGGGATEANVQDRSQRGLMHPRNVSRCLRLCLGWVGAVGGAAGVPVTVLLNLRTSQCLYTCITLVCCPMLVRHFTMLLMLLLTLDGHLQRHLESRYSSLITHQRALCAVLLCWVASLLSSFAQFIGSDVLDAWRRGVADSDTVELQGNWTTSLPHATPSPPPKYKVIGQYLPYGGFLSKFYVEDMRNVSYAERHKSHWGVCAPDTVLSPHFLVYVHGTMVFMLPLLCLLLIYLHMLCIKPRKTPSSHPPKPKSNWLRSLTLSLSLLVLLCLPLHIIHALSLFTPSTNVPAWAHAAATLLFQTYGLVPQILFTRRKKRAREEQPSFPLSVQQLPPALAPPRGKSVRKVLCDAVQAAPWSSAKHSLKARVCPEV
ncbi:adenosine receptor A1-like [Brachionichthys hirsutus]|uniref:adenosine receptor A1-like n=1 Tax=Brachionichthys hirsutus TaxID=412623 RepID=UPI003604FFCB